MIDAGQTHICRVFYTFLGGELPNGRVEVEQQRAGAVLALNPAFAQAERYLFLTHTVKIHRKQQVTARACCGAVLPVGTLKPFLEHRPCTL
ncbi:MAG: hypothetical protein F9K29_23150 [Hyphomicrobiaceae bacterium]|nr:MAG: hypothetical protein F9K29_23150 [Hyphomicrobiaceae bacterium]